MLSPGTRNREVASFHSFPTLLHKSLKALNPDLAFWPLWSLGCDSALIGKFWDPCNWKEYTILIHWGKTKDSPKW